MIEDIVSQQLRRRNASLRNTIKSTYKNVVRKKSKPPKKLSYSQNKMPSQIDAQIHSFVGYLSASKKKANLKDFDPVVSNSTPYSTRDITILMKHFLRKEEKISTFETANNVASVLLSIMDLKIDQIEATKLFVLLSLKLADKFKEFGEISKFRFFCCLAEEKILPEQHFLRMKILNKYLSHSVSESISSSRTKAICFEILRIGELIRSQESPTFLSRHEGIEINLILINALCYTVIGEIKRPNENSLLLCNDLIKRATDIVLQNREIKQFSPAERMVFVTRAQLDRQTPNLKLLSFKINHRTDELQKIQQCLEYAKEIRNMNEKLVQVIITIMQLEK